MKVHSEGGIESGPRRLPIWALVCWPCAGRSWLWALPWVLLWMTLGLPRLAWAAEAGEIVSVLGQAEVLREGRWQAAAPGDVLAVGETVKTAADSRLALQLANGSQIKLNANSQLELKQLTPRDGLAPTADAPPHNLLRLLGGEAWVRSTAIPLEIQTTIVIATIRGTEFNLAVAGEAARLAVVAGEVEFHNPQGRVWVGAREQATARRGEAPRKTVLLDPLDAVQWSLYYPGLVSYRDYPLAGAAPTDGETRFDAGDRDGARQAFTRALERDPRDPRARAGLGWVLLESGQTEAALAEFQQVRPPTLMSLVGAANALYRLNRVPDADRAIAAAQARDPRAPLPWVQAALNHLIRGRVPDAHQALDQALARDPHQALALSLRANIYLVQNRPADALDAARQAVAANPASPAAHLSQSAAHQARFDLDAALAAARQARAHDPQNPQALIQESRLLFGMGRLNEATQLARQARQRAPQDALISSTWGFLQLARHHPDQARQAFQAAIAQDSTLGEPHLGLGLALFRQNQPQAATNALRKATLLEPQVSLYNSYLGKAYLELNEPALAQKYFAQAAQLDPRDPTPHFYDALRRQSANQPTQAVQSLQHSIALNNNRAVYRSQLLLDQDLATRDTNLARIYDDLGFNQLAQTTASQSLSLAPSNYSAHRFLSDSYATRPRHEIARISELLQAQLLQPINLNPIQPSLNENNLKIVNGFGTTSFNEYTSLFERDGAQITASGVFGNHNTMADEVIISGIQKQLAYSLGQFHYETDGFRKNNDQQHDIYNLFAQLALTPDFSLQAEFRRRQTEEGYLNLNFDSKSLLPDYRRTLNQNSARLGGRWGLSRKSDLIFSFINTKREETIKYSQIQDPLGRAIIDLNNIEEGYQLEAQHLFKTPSLNTVTGVSSYNIDINEQHNFTIPLPIFPYSYTQENKQNYRSKRDNFYIYNYFNYPDKLAWTIGLSYDIFQEGEHEIYKLNPKIGLQWNISDDTRLRLAFFETVKPALVVEQTLEPTQVSGFNQFYDDMNGTQVKHHNIGVDTRFTNDVFGGIELSRRDLKAPIVEPKNHTLEINRIEDRQEDLYHAYLYWILNSNWSLSAEYQFERFECIANCDINTTNATFTQIDTTVVPLTIKYFGSTGFFSNLTASYIHQSIEKKEILEAHSQDETGFLVVDSTIGYRLPKRQGIISFEIKNLFNEKFNFQDTNFQTSEAKNPRFIPERLLFFQATFNF